MNDKAILHLKVVFKVSITAFEVSSLFKETNFSKRMIELNKIALSEINKKNPDFDKIQFLIYEMEKLSTKENEKRNTN